MSEEGHPWTVRFTATAEVDYQNIIDWTLRQSGDLQARVYAETLAAALAALTAGPMTVGAKDRRESGKGLSTLHVARGGHKGRHFALFRIVQDKRHRCVEVLRLLHDAMDLRLHVPGT
jgi:toxin ParE1/3/4